MPTLKKTMHQWLMLIILLFSSAKSLEFIFNDFNNGSSPNLTMVGGAFLDKETRAISITSNAKFSKGRAYYSEPINTRTTNSSHVDSFSTNFVFCIIPQSVPPGPGMAFVISATKSNANVSESQYLGLFSDTNNTDPYNNSIFAVEFDTSQSPEFHDIDHNHVGIDLNSLVSSAASTAGFWTSEAEFKPITLSDRRCIHAWIDYEYTNNQLNVTIADLGDERPIRPLISVMNLSLSDVIPETAYVGFSASTASTIEQHYIMAWSFKTNGNAQELDNVSQLHSFIVKTPFVRTRGFKVLIIVAIIITVILLGVGRFFLWMKNRKYYKIEEWEKLYWPHRVPYSHLRDATNGFHEDNVLGQGGFGKVYKGVLDGYEIAVKAMLHENSNGARDFIAEISSIGRLQHRNLLPLKGWCKTDNKLFIVYEFMPNGGLDKAVHSPSGMDWSQRLAVAKGVASGLVHLHEESNQVIIHRDIKPSNILLDAEMNARIGDFGLAKLYEHEEDPSTTRIVGTPGYMAVELVHTGRATTASDVYGYGIMLLEIASGRKPMSFQYDVPLVEWVRSLHDMERVVEAADPKLNGIFDCQEMETVLRIGLLCTCFRAHNRPSMRRVLQLLDDGLPSFVIPPLT